MDWEEATMKRTGSLLVILTCCVLAVVIGAGLIYYIQAKQQAADLALEVQSLQAELAQLRQNYEATVLQDIDRIQELKDRIAELTTPTASPDGAESALSELPETTLSTLAEPEPEPAPQPAPTPTVTPQPRPTVNANVVNHAKLLVWKYLDEPRYDVLTITRTDNTVARIWDVSGRFAYVGGRVQTFDAIIEEQASGDWWLLAFSWT